MSVKEPISAVQRAQAVAEVFVPTHVVYRAFPAETVVLNLQTGKYHGLNATAGRMLEALDRTETVAQAIALLSEEFDQPASRVESDVLELCEALINRRLLLTERESD